MPAGRYLRTINLNWIRGVNAPAAPLSVWLHLCTSAPTATAPGAAPLIASYAPIQIIPASWGAIVIGANLDSMPTNATFTFGPYGAGATQIATHAMIMDGSNPLTANLIDYGALVDPRLMVTGGTTVVGPGDIVVTA